MEREEVLYERDEKGRSLKVTCPWATSAPTGGVVGATSAHKR